jgi:hypothetical protein
MRVLVLLLRLKVAAETLKSTTQALKGVAKMRASGIAEAMP